MNPITSKTPLGTRFEFIGGSVCLDFTNTVGGVRGGHFREGLMRYTDLVRWSRQAVLLVTQMSHFLSPVNSKRKSLDNTMQQKRLMPCFALTFSVHGLLQRLHLQIERCHFSKMLGFANVIMVR